MTPRYMYALVDEKDRIYRLDGHFCLYTLDDRASAEYDKLECEKEKERHGNNPPSEFSKFIPFEKLKIIKVELMEGNNEQCGYKNRLAKIYEIF